MPIYEYTCRKCGAHLEVMRKISDKPLARHASCGGRLEKEWSRTGFQFKGSGWYVTDYAGKKSEANEGKESEPIASESKKADAADAKTKGVESKGKESKDSKPASTKAPTSGD